MQQHQRYNGELKRQHSVCFRPLPIFSSTSFFFLSLSLSLSTNHQANKAALEKMDKGLEGFYAALSEGSLSPPTLATITALGSGWLVVEDHSPPASRLLLALPLLS